MVFLLFQIFHIMNKGTALKSICNLGVLSAFHHFITESLSCKKGPLIPPAAANLHHSLLAIGHLMNKCSIISLSFPSQHLHITLSHILILTSTSSIGILFFHNLQIRKDTLKGFLFIHNFLKSSRTSPGYLKSPKQI